MHPCGLPPAQAAGQVKHPREAGLSAGRGRVAGAPVQTHLALGVRVGELHVVHLQRDFVAVYLPAGIGRKAVQRQHRLVEHTGQLQRPPFDVEHRAATSLGHIEVHVGTAHPRHSHRMGPGTRRHRLGGQCQAGHPPPGLVFLGRSQGALPGGIHHLHQPSRGIGLQCGMGGFTQRQAVGNLAQHRQIEPVGM